MVVFISANYPTIYQGMTVIARTRFVTSKQTSRQKVQHQIAYPLHIPPLMANETTSRQSESLPLPLEG